MPLNTIYLYVSGTYDALEAQYIPGLSASLSLYSPINRLQYNATSVSNNVGYIEFNISDLTASILSTDNDKYYTDYDITVYYGDRQDLIAPTETSSYMPFSYIKTTRFGNTNMPALDDVDLGTVVIESIPGTIAFQDVYNSYASVSASYTSASAVFDTATNTSNLGIELEKNQPYEPQYEYQIVTRLLEYQSGSLGASIAYATSASLVAELTLLTELNQLINTYATLYPTVLINSGEGIPYQ